MYKAKSPNYRCTQNENINNNSTFSNHLSPSTKTPTFYNEFML